MKNKDGALRWGLAIFLTVSAILLFYEPCLAAGYYRPSAVSCWARSSR